MNNREYMKHTFDQIHASSELEERIMGMKKEKRNENVKKWVAVAASLALVFLASNVITYAQTGKTWIQLISGEHYTKGDWNMGKLIPVTRPDGNTYYVQVGKASNGAMVASYEAEDVEVLKDRPEEEWLAEEADMSKFKNVSAEKIETGEVWEYYLIITIDDEVLECHDVSMMSINDPTHSNVYITPVSLDGEKYFATVIFEDEGADVHLYYQ